MEIIEISEKFQHAADCSAVHAGPAGGTAGADRYTTKIERVIIFVLPHQVKMKVAGNCAKSVEKSTENNRNLVP